MVALAAVAFAFVFGAADQYLGSVPGHFGAFAWTADISLLSAPWLLIAFAGGYTQRDPRRAIAVGFAVTMVALVGYMFMTMSPIENAHLSATGIVGFAHSDVLTFVGGLASGPLFGWLGHRWRVARSWPAALFAAAVLCFEPLAHRMIGRPIRSGAVSLGEVAVGIALAVVIGMARRPAVGSGLDQVHSS
jgi:hypothetical protein